MKYSTGFIVALHVDQTFLNGGRIRSSSCVWLNCKIIFFSQAYRAGSSDARSAFSPGTQKEPQRHLWYVSRFELLQNRMNTKDPVPSSIGVVIPGNVRLAFWGGSVYTTQSGKVQRRGFPLWLVEGNEVGTLTFSTARATDFESTVR